MVLDRFSKGLISTAFFLFVTVPFNLIFRRYFPKSSSNKNQLLERLKRGPIAHRGGVPENTVTAFHRSKEAGASIVEVDLQFTKDGQPVLFHDYKVDRVSDRSGNLTDYTLEEIQSLDVGYKFGFDNVKVPTLYESVEALQELDMIMFLEIKSIKKDYIRVITKMFEQDPSLYNRIVVISFFPDILYQLKKIDSKVVVGLIIRETFFTKPPSELFNEISPDKQKIKYFFVNFFQKIVMWLLKTFVWKIIDVGLILPHKEDILKGRFDCEYYRKKGLHVITWTVNSKDEQEYFTHLGLPYMTDHVSNDLYIELPAVI